MGGLTYRSGADRLYAISSDETPLFPVARRVNEIALEPALSVTPLFDLGDGGLAFDGGLLFDPATDGFRIIANDSLGDSTLWRFTLSGGGAIMAVGPGLGAGLSNASLIAVPEPFGLRPLVAGLVALAALRRRPLRRCAAWSPNQDRHPQLRRKT